VLAGTLRLVVLAVGGWMLACAPAPPWTLFALVGFAMAAYGVATAVALRPADWGLERITGTAPQT